MYTYTKCDTKRTPPETLIEEFKRRVSNVIDEGWHLSNKNLTRSPCQQ